jgi:mitotic spindle assembly checkpoint protein MAD2
MSTSAIDTQTVITLKGSVEIVSEFFFTAINSILYQRGIYQPESFSREEKYGLTVLTTTDESLKEYLNNIMSQMGQWLLAGDVQKLVVVVAGIDSGETLERWQFNVNVDDESAIIGGGVHQDENNPLFVNANKAPPVSTKKNSVKSMQEVHNEIQAIIRQITASVSWFVRCWMTICICCDQHIAEWYRYRIT